MRILLLATIALLLTDAAAARDLYYPGIIGNDDRTVIDSSEPPWPAIGKIEIAGYSELLSCTGVLVARNVVVTAAHCLRNLRTGKQVGAKRVNFIAGVRRDANLGHSVGSCIKLLGPLPDPKRMSPQNMTPDAAIVVLAEPLDVQPIAVIAVDSDLVAGALVTHAGYGRDRPYLLSAHTNCRVRQVWPKLIATDCDTNFGQSGGPLLIQRGNQWQVAAIMSGFVEKQASLAVPVSAWRGLVTGGACQE